MPDRWSILSSFASAVIFVGFLVLINAMINPAPQHWTRALVGALVLIVAFTRVDFWRSQRRAKGLYSIPPIFILAFGTIGIAGLSWMVWGPMRQAEREPAWCIVLVFGLSACMVVAGAMTLSGRGRRATGTGSQQ